MKLSLIRYLNRAYTEKFVDYQIIKACGGNGGNGFCSFLKLKYNEFAGPDGGDGGNGGHVIIKASKKYKSLNHVLEAHQADFGEHGYNKNKYGKCADHYIIPVPLGTIASHVENNQAIGTLNNDGQFMVISRGGSGGKGNAFFLSNDNRKPLSYELGGKGQKNDIALELKYMADIGLVGFPNSGKSSLLKCISNANPKIAAYPFTTINPSVGIIEEDIEDVDQLQISVADLPGIIEGSHLNIGRGISFLKHIKRCRKLIYVINLSEKEHGSVISQFEKLNFELTKFDEKLNKRPCMLIANKLDLIEPKNEKILTKHLTKLNIPLVTTSAINNINVDILKVSIRKFVNETK